VESAHCRNGGIRTCFLFCTYDFGNPRQRP
jgi:hypothetical protein